MRTLGICTAGLEEAFETCIKERLHYGFTYLEIGLAHCQTFLTVRDILEEEKVSYRMFGVDPCSFGFDPEEVLKQRLPGNRLIVIEGRVELVTPPLNTVTLFRGERQQVFQDPLEAELDVVFIDGCHALNCSVGDFLSVEPMMRKGGVVIFHDFGLDSQGQMQPHCNAPTAIREAVERLGLMDEKRRGWKRLPDWKGDASRMGADCGVFERTI